MGPSKIRTMQVQQYNYYYILAEQGRIFISMSFIFIFLLSTCPNYLFLSENCKQVTCGSRQVGV